MKKLSILLFILAGNLLFSQKNLPVIQASADKVDIKIGDKLYKNRWTIMPDIRPDISYSGDVGQKLILYTDMDSIQVNINKIPILISLSSLRQNKIRLIPRSKYTRTLPSHDFDQQAKRLHDYSPASTTTRRLFER